MKCLRCGRVLKDGQTECECGHFYENNLNHKTFIKNTRDKSNILVNIIIIISIIMVIVLTAYFRLSNRKNNSKYNEICEVKCEGSSYRVVDYKCVCSNGEEYTIE